MNDRKDSMPTGFTIVELLIVIVIIAILAAVTMVTFSGVQNRAQNTATQTDLRNLGKKVQEFAAIQGHPPLANEDDLGPLLKVNKEAYLETASGAAQTTLLYCRTDNKWGLVGRSKGGQSWVIDNGTLRQISEWSGGNDNSACGTNTNVKLQYASEPGYGYTNLYRGGNWQTWVQEN